MWEETSGREKKSEMCFPQDKVRKDLSFDALFPQRTERRITHSGKMRREHKMKFHLNFLDLNFLNLKK